MGQIAGAFQNLSNHFKIAGNPNSVIFDNPGGKEFAADIAGAKDYRVLHPRTKQEVVPTLLDGRQIPYTPTNFPRLELAKYMTSDRSPQYRAASGSEAASMRLETKSSPAGS